MTNKIKMIAILGLFFLCCGCKQDLEEDLELIDYHVHIFSPTLISHLDDLGYDLKQSG